MIMANPDRKSPRRFGPESQPIPFPSSSRLARSPLLSRDKVAPSMGHVDMDVIICFQKEINHEGPGIVKDIVIANIHHDF